MAFRRSKQTIDKESMYTRLMPSLNKDQDDAEPAEDSTVIKEAVRGPQPRPIEVVFEETDRYDDNEYEEVVFTKPSRTDAPGARMPRKAVEPEPAEPEEEYEEYNEEDFLSKRYEPEYDTEEDEEQPDEEYEDDPEDEEDEPAAAAPRRDAPKAARSKTAARKNASSAEEDQEKEAPKKTPRKTPSPKRRPVQRKDPDTDDSIEEEEQPKRSSRKTVPKKKAVESRKVAPKKVNTRKTEEEAEQEEERSEENLKKTARNVPRVSAYARQLAERSSDRDNGDYSEYEVININEELMKLRFNDIFDKFHCCHCNACRFMVMALSLNLLESKYISVKVSERENVIRNVDDSHIKATIIQSILKLMINPIH